MTQHIHQPTLSSPLTPPNNPLEAVDPARTTEESVAPTRTWWILAVLSALMGFASISTDLYLPAMPAMQGALHASAGTVELTISGYLIGFSLGQLLWGPIGDLFGRRVPVAIGLVLFITGSVGCAMSDSAQAMIGWRVVQAAGACASVVLARAMVRDLYAGAGAAQMMSTLMTVMAVAPLVGPSLGGLILQVASWHAIFWVLVGVGLATLLALNSLPETLPSARRIREPLSRALGRYALLLEQPRLLGYAGAGGFFYGGMYAYIAGSPFAYIDYHHVLPEHYGLLFALGISGIMVTNLINARLVTKFGGDRLMRLGAIVATATGLAAALDTGMDWGGLPGLVVPLFIFVSATGLIVANSISGVLNTFPQFAGSVSALVGAIQYGAGIVGSGLVSAFANGTPWPMGAVVAACGVGSLLSALIVRGEVNAQSAAVGHCAGRMTVHA
jgi:DHA1 family bicyclomycin/chloramphenicol resistance-like MFS transporter